MRMVYFIKPFGKSMKGRYTNGIEQDCAALD
jgi:hypothetical protein